MEDLLLVYVDDIYDPPLCDAIAQLDGVETVFALNGRDPDFVVVVKPHMGQKVALDIEYVLGARLVNVREVLSRQEGSRRIIDVDDIPGPLPVPNAHLRVAQPVITSADIPGPVPAMRAPARVHRNFSSQAGLASFAGSAGMRGFGSGLPELGKLSY